MMMKWVRNYESKCMLLSHNRAEIQYYNDQSCHWHRLQFEVKFHRWQYTWLWSVTTVMVVDTSSDKTHLTYMKAHFFIIIYTCINCHTAPTVSHLTFMASTKVFTVWAQSFRKTKPLCFRVAKRCLWWTQWVETLSAPGRWRYGHSTWQ